MGCNCGLKYSVYSIALHTMRKIPTAFTLDQLLIDWLKAESIRRDITMSKIVRELLIREMAAQQPPKVPT